MEDITFNTDGSYNLPVGFRFDPNNEILLNYCLRRKMFGEHVTEIMKHVNVFQTEPWNLPADEERLTRRKYYFFDLRNIEFINKDKRVSGNGEWRTEKAEKVISLQSPHHMGKKTTLVYWKMQPTGDFLKTNWTMHEFRLSLAGLPFVVSHLAAYRIFEKTARREERKATKKVRGKFKRTSRKASVIDVFAENGDGSATPPPPVTP